MIVQVEFDDGYEPVWNKMHEMFVPCRAKVVKLGEDYENKKQKFYDFAKKLHNPTDLLSAELYTMLMKQMDAAHAKLKPFKDEWMRSRYGIGLN